MNRRKVMENILLWGSLWGLEEATLGHFLHLFGVFIGWVFWFPLAFFFMHRVYRNTNRESAVLFCALLAAAIKLTDLLLPTRLDLVINPAAAILLEGCAVFAVFFMLDKKPNFASLPLWGIGAGLLQGVLYLTYILIIPFFIPQIPPIKGLESGLIILLHSLINGMTIFVFLKYFKNIVNLLSIKYPAFLNKVNHALPSRAAAPFFPYLLFIFTLFIVWAL